MILITNVIFGRIARAVPDLKVKLRKASMQDKPDQFIKKTILIAFYMTTGTILFLFLLLSKYTSVNMILLIFAPLMFIFLFYYMLKLPDVKINKMDKEINKEIVFAGRHLIIELESGVPLYDSIVNVSKNYETIGRYLSEIIDKVNLGTPIEDAINEAIDLIPSRDFRRILWQILNSLRTGSDVVDALHIAIEQIVKEQKIQVDKYGRKLNPLSMFYMIIAVILPSLGITMLLILFSFIDIELNLVMLLFISFMLGFLQFMFLSIIKFSRPPLEF